MRAMRIWSVRHARALEGVYNAFSRIAAALAPVARRVPRSFLETAVKAVERPAKRFMFDCSMCGRCLLSRTGMACPMVCPKGLRNGPCGGVFQDGGCEMDPGMRCVWLEAWDGARRMADGAAIGGLHAPAAAHLAGRSTWMGVLLGEPTHPPWPTEAQAAEPSAPADDPTPSGLARVLAAGEFALTCEFDPPDAAEPGPIQARAEEIAGLCDAVNATDNAGANVHISSVALSAILVGAGIEPVMQMACRDRNRLAIQADILGAAALGVRNLLCMTGDAVEGGDHADAKPVFDLDAATLLRTAGRLSGEGRFLSGRELATKPELFLGATVNPCALESETEIQRMAKKIEAGARFFQSQFCFDMERLEGFLAAMRAAGLDRRAKLILGAGPLVSARSARWMRTHIAGMWVPDDLIARLDAASDPREEGILACVEIIRRMREMDGVAGVHIMAIGRQELIADVVDAARVGPRHRGTIRPD